MDQEGYSTTRKTWGEKKEEKGSRTCTDRPSIRGTVHVESRDMLSGVALVHVPWRDRRKLFSGGVGGIHSIHAK
jgi:hypothetical protein